MQTLSRVNNTLVLLACASTDSHIIVCLDCYTPEKLEIIPLKMALLVQQNIIPQFRGIHINESTARRLKMEYLKKFEKEISKQSNRHGEDIGAREPTVLKIEVGHCS